MKLFVEASSKMALKLGHPRGNSSEEQQKITARNGRRLSAETRHRTADPRGPRHEVLPLDRLGKRWPSQKLIVRPSAIRHVSPNHPLTSPSFNGLEPKTDFTPLIDSGSLGRRARTVQPKKKEQHSIAFIASSSHEILRSPLKRFLGRNS